MLYNQNRWLRHLAVQAIKADCSLVTTLSEPDRRDLEKRLKDVESILPFQILSAYCILAKGTSRRVEFHDVGMPTVGEKSLSEWVKGFLENEEMLPRCTSPRYVQERLLGEREEMEYRTMADGFFTSLDNPFLESEEVLRTAVADGVRQRFFGLKIGEQIYFDEGIVPALVGDEAQVVNKEIAAPWKEERERQEQERKERGREDYEPPEREKEPSELRKAEEEIELRPEGHRLKIIARVPWDKLSEFMSGVLLPLQSAGAEVILKVELTAQSQEPIGPGVLDLKVRETLQQIGAKVESFQQG